MFRPIEPYLVVVMIAIVTILTIPYLQQRPPAPMQSIILPLKKFTPHTSDPAHIRLYPFSPGLGTPIALVNIERHYAAASDQITHDMEQEAKRLAATIGADAVIIKHFGRTKASQASTLNSIYVFRGVAMRSGDEA